MRMWNLFLCVIFCASCASSHAATESSKVGAKDLKLQYDSKGAHLVHPAFKDTKFRLSVYSGQPEVVEWRQLKSPEHYLLIYKAGVMGTSHKLHVLRAKVINVSERKEIIDEIWKYQGPDGKADKQVVDPEWTFTATNILLKTSSDDKPEVISLD